MRPFLLSIKNTMRDGFKMPCALLLQKFAPAGKTFSLHVVFWATKNHPLQGGFETSQISYREIALTGQLRLKLA
ncbi:MAG: hypothetical protein ACI37O_08440 [Candidatus Avelusimicrobium sp.]|uniref:hypothetical protein n=1 Tax=Candidatus Avelusimicrobium sp. TaxID=3048833 RepID=UPI003F1011A8